MAPQFSVSRLRRLIDQRDSARSALDIAATRLKQATAEKRSAERAVQEFESASLVVKTDQQAAQAEASLARLRASLVGASEALDSANQNRAEAAEVVNVTAALASSGIEFAVAGNWCPPDIRERA